MPSPRNPYRLLADTEHNKISNLCEALRLVLCKSPFYVLSQLLTPAEHLYVSYQFSRLGVNGAAAYALIVTSRATIDSIINTVSTKLSSEISKAKGLAESGEQTSRCVGEKFRVGITLSFLESLASAALFYFGAKPAFLAVGQSPATVATATPYLERYALATVLKSLALPLGAAAKGLLKPGFAWTIRATCLIIPNLAAYYYFDTKQANVEVFANAAMVQAGANTCIMTALLACHPDYCPYQFFSLEKYSWETLVNFIEEIKTLFKASFTYALQTMSELSTLLGQALYIKAYQGEAALAFFNAESQIIMLIVAAAIGFHNTAMNHAGARLASNPKSSWIIAKASLLLGIALPIASTIVLPLAPTSVGKAFIPPATTTNATTADPELFASVGTLAMGNLILDSLRLGAGILLINYNEHFKPAATGIINLWSAFGLAVILNLFADVNPLLSFAIANYTIAFGALFLGSELYKRATNVDRITFSTRSSRAASLAGPGFFSKGKESTPPNTTQNRSLSVLNK